MFRTIAKIANFAAFLSFERSCANPKAAQQKVWREIKCALSGSAQWRGLLDDKSEIHDFEITNYSFYEPQIKESLKSKTSQLNGEPVLFFAESAGSSGVAKIFPITPSYKRQFLRTRAVLLYRWVGHYQSFLKEKSLFLAATEMNKYSGSGVEIGYISNFNYRKIPGFLRGKYALPYEIYRSDEAFDRYAPLMACLTDISNLIAVTPGVISIFFQSILKRKSEILSFLTGEFQDQRMSEFLQTVSTSRKDYLVDILSRDVISIKELWPKLEFICCWQSAACTLQMSSLRKNLGEGVSIYDAIYSATEGWINVPLQPNQLGGAVHPGAHVFEFIEKGKAIEKNNLLALDELVVGGQYEIFITNAMGLVRYRLGDLVECTGFYKNTPVIHFVGKADSELSLGLATVHEQEVVSAIAHIDSLNLENVVCTVNRDGNGLLFYVSGVESIEEYWPAQLDGSIKSQNPVYSSYRGNGQIAGVEVELRSKSEVLQLKGQKTHNQAKPKVLIC